MQNVKFSVAMCVYAGDRPDWFRMAVDSILNQTRKPDEVVLVVDGPVSRQIDQAVEEYEKRSEFQVIRLPKNGGLGNALKIAVENATHELIARMDSDDISLPTRFEEQLRFFEGESDVDLVGGDIAEFEGNEGNVVAYRRVPTTDTEIKKYLMKRCPMNHMSVMFRKRAVQAAGGYLDLFWNEDYYLWIRMAEHHAVMANTGTVLVNARIGADMYKRRGGRMYFESEKFLQKYMLRKKMISKAICLENVLKRWIVQVVLPNQLRGWVFKKFARKVM